MFGYLLALCCPGFETLGSRFIPLVCDSPGDGHRGGNARHPIKPVCPQLLLSFGQGLDHRFSLLSPLHGVPPHLLHPMFSPTRGPPRRSAFLVARLRHLTRPLSHPPTLGRPRPTLFPWRASVATRSRPSGIRIDAQLSSGTEPFPSCCSYDFLLACPAVFNHSVWA